MQLAVFLWRFACENMEGADKVAVIVKAAEVGGFGDRLSLIQKTLCVADTNENSVFFDRNTHAFFEIRDQLGAADKEVVGKHINGDVLGVMCADIFDDLTDIAF